jgi:hypothetical protein
MKKNTRLVILSILAVLIVIVIAIGVTRAFLKPVVDENKVVEVSLSSCAKIKLSDGNSINLANSYPMSRNRGINTTPYTFTVTSNCDKSIGFNLYLATLNTSTLEASSIHYIVTSNGSKTALAEGTLTTDVSSAFTDTDKTELNAGLGGTYGNIYKLYNSALSVNSNTTYDLYLYIDENVTSYQEKTFVAGVAIKSYDL